MKWTTVLVLIVSVAVVAESARQGGRNFGRNSWRGQNAQGFSGQQGGRGSWPNSVSCKYDFKAATCDEASNKMVAPLIAAESTDPNCEPTKPLRMSCDQMIAGQNAHGGAAEQWGHRSRSFQASCKYDFKAATCDEASNQMVAPLIAAESTDPNCELTKVLRVSCDQMSQNARGAPAEHWGHGFRPSQVSCKYDFKAATCDEASNKMVAPLIAAESTDPNCELTKVLRMSCDQMVGGLNAHGSPAEQGGHGPRPFLVSCKYDFNAATCDEASNKMVAPLIVAESTDPNCELTKTLRMPCNQMRCVYNVRDACNAAAGATMATAQLVADRSDPACPPTKDFECRRRNN